MLKNLSLKKYLIIFSICTAIAFLSYLKLDLFLSNYFFQPELKSFWLFCREITNFALAEYYYILTLIVYLISRKDLRLKLNWQPVSKNLLWWRNWAVNFFYSLIFGGITVLLLKILFGRLRPHKTSPEFDHNIFELFNIHWDYQSLPSGHSQVSLTLGVFFTLAFPKLRWITFPLSIFLAFTRVVTHDHYLSDVIMGACLGYIASWMTIEYLNNKNSQFAIPLKNN